MQETLRDMGSIPGLERCLGGSMATYSSILAWRIPGTEEPGMQSIGWQRGGHDRRDLACTHAYTFQCYSLKSSHIFAPPLCPKLFISFVEKQAEVLGGDFWEILFGNWDMGSWHHLELWGSLSMDAILKLKQRDWKSIDGSLFHETALSALNCLPPDFFDFSRSLLFPDSELAAKRQFPTYLICNVDS